MCECVSVCECAAQERGARRLTVRVCASVCVGENERKRVCVREREEGGARRLAAGRVVELARVSEPGRCVCERERLCVCECVCVCECLSVRVC